MHKLIVLAGNREKWQAEIVSKCRAGSYEGTFNSDDLCKVQSDQHGRGRMEAVFTTTIFGFSVRLRSGLFSDQVLFGGRMMGRRVEKEEALAWGISWANQDPDHRTFIMFEDQDIIKVGSYQ